MRQNTVVLRIQVIDMEPQTLDLTLPDYLPASDLSQRIARDAGLKPYWPNNTRKHYQLRARGRLMQRNETLKDLNVVDNELIYILPQIRPNTQVQEQYPEYPEETNYIAGALSVILILVVVILSLSIGWGLSITESTHWTTLCLPAVGVGVLCTSFSRHALGGRARDIKVLLLGLGMFALATLPCFLVSYFVPAVDGFVSRMFPGIVTGLVGSVLSWISWWGPVEALNKKKQEEIKEVATKDLPICAICGGAVMPNVLMRSANNCPTCAPNVFHKGCYNAKLTAYYGPEGHCKICKRYLG